MSRGDVSYSIRSEVAQVLAAAEEMKRAQAKVTNEFGETTAEAAKLDRMARQISSSVETLEQRHERMRQEAQKAFDTNRIGLNEYEARIKQIDEQFEDLKDTAEDTGSSFESLFGTASVAKLSAFLGGVVSIREALQAFEAVGDRSAERAIEASGAAGQLAQLAGGDPNRLRGLLGAGADIFRGGGFQSIEDAYRLTFELESAGALGESGFFGGLQAVDDAAQVARSAALVRQAFGAGEAGSFSDVVDKAFAAAAPATGVNVSDILIGVARAGKSGAELGLSDEEVFSSVSRLAQITGSGAEAGTQANALFRSLTRQGFADAGRQQPLAATIRGISDQGLSPAALIEFFGRQEAAAAFQVLRDVGQLDQRTQEVSRAQLDDIAQQTIGIALDQPEIAIGRRATAARASRELSERGLGERSAAIDIRRDLFVSDAIERGDSPFAAETVDFFRGVIGAVTPDFLEISAQGARDAILGGGETMDDLARNLEEFNRHQEQVEENGRQQLEELKKINSKTGQGGILVGPE